MVDRTTKALLFAIALGLWMHVAGDWVRPAPVQAQGFTLEDSTKQLAAIERHLKNIETDTASMRVSLSAMAASDAIRKR